MIYLCNEILLSKQQLTKKDKYIFDNNLVLDILNHKFVYRFIIFTIMRALFLFFIYDFFQFSNILLSFY